MEKMLHERLRKYSEDSRIECVVVDVKNNEILFRGEANKIADEIERDYIPKSEYEERSAHDVMRAYAEDEGMPFGDCETISEWLNRWFVPRPRYDDGAPVQFDDRDIDWGYPDGYYANAITSGGQVLAVGGRQVCATAKMTDEGLIKRKSPKVLDADGVEVKVGDTVWHIEIPEMQMTVDSFDAIYWTYMTVNCAFNGRIYNFDPKNLTHREPDSLEKLRDDLIAAHERWDGDPNKLVDYADRLTALIERGA